MSLYNALFGYNPMAGHLLKALEIDPTAVPRFRDCYMVKDEKQIIIYTRTGGGNRDYYESEEDCRRNYPEYFSPGQEEHPSGPWNENLRKIPGYLRDEDDSFDSTYAKFYYSIPDQFESLLVTLYEIMDGGVPEPEERWKALLKDLETGAQTEQTARALEMGRTIFNALEDKDNPNPIIEV